jgi:hypothetical protein
MLARPSAARSAGEKLFVYGGGLLALALIVAHAFVSRDRGTLLAAILAGAVNAAAIAGGFVLILLGGGCGDHGHIPVGAWIGGGLVYIAGAAWGLRARWHAVWLVPVSTLAGAVLIVALSTILTGSTGACLE